MTIKVKGISKTVNIPVKVYTDDYYYQEYIDNGISFEGGSE